LSFLPQQKHEWKYIFVSQLSEPHKGKVPWYHYSTW